MVVGEHVVWNAPRCSMRTERASFATGLVPNVLNQMPHEGKIKISTDKKNNLYHRYYLQELHIHTHKHMAIVLFQNHTIYIYIIIYIYNYIYIYIHTYIHTYTKYRYVASIPPALDRWMFYSPRIHGAFSNSRVMTVT